MLLGVPPYVWSSVTTILSLLTITGLCGGQAVSTTGWTGLRVTAHSHVTGAQSLADVTVCNARQCIRMCWLYRACAAVTITSSYRQHQQLRCQLFKLTGNDANSYSLMADRDSQSVDMREAKVDNRLFLPRGCDKRPCSETEMCAPVKHHAIHTCVKLASEFCRGDPPVVRNSIPERDNIGTVLYTCAHGYFRSGTNHISICNRASGIWSSVDTVCSLVDCGKPPSVYGASHSFSGTTANSVVYYTCLTGAIPTSASMTSTCDGNTRQWSETPGPCVVVSCGHPPVVSSDFELQARPIRGAFPGLDSYQLEMAYGGVAVYTCADGYSLPTGNTSYTSQCQADGTWSSIQNFQCFPVDCGQPPSVANSNHITHTTTTFGDTVTVKCLLGFSPLSGLNFTCTETGYWEGTERTCELIDCGMPPPVENATVLYSGTGLNFTANYSCVEPAVTSGIGDSTCMTTGQWSPVSISCLTVPCGHSPDVANSSVEYIVGNGQVKASYTCDHGFQLVSASNMTCLANATWTTEEVSCSYTKCTFPDLQDNAQFVEILHPKDTFNFGDTLTFQCRDQFEMVPINSNIEISVVSYMTCQPDNTWTSPHPQVYCLPAACGVPLELPFTTWSLLEYSNPYNAVYQCIEGYTVAAFNSNGIPSPTNIAECVSSIGWDLPSEIIGGCSPVDCGGILILKGSPLEVPMSYNTTYGSRVELSCAAPLYVNSPENVVECQADEYWSNLNDSTVCAPCDQSGEVPEILKGLLELNTTLDPVADRARFKCETGYRAFGAPDEIQCASLNYTVVWQGLDYARCARTVWENPIPRHTDTSNRYSFNLDPEDCCPDGLRACAELTFYGYKEMIFFLLADVNSNASSYYLPVLRVLYRGEVPDLTFEQQIQEGTDNTTTKVMPIDLIQINETATLCINLDPTIGMYQFTKNNRTVMDMPVLSHKFNRIIIKHSVNISIFTVDYDIYRGIRVEN